MNTQTSSASASMTLPLAGKVAFVTGGARGIGAAIAQRLAADGAAVALTYTRSEAEAGAVVAAIEAAGGRALALRADSADDAALEAAIERTVAVYGRLDILVNSAGVLALGSIEDFDLAGLDRTLAVNVRAVVVASRLAARHRHRQGTRPPDWPAVADHPALSCRPGAAGPAVPPFPHARERRFCGRAASPCRLGRSRARHQRGRKCQEAARA